MRNGNYKEERSNKILQGGSYPTYEEWKQSLFCMTSFDTHGSYPTYEEWKHAFLLPFLPVPDCSYPTYEEWKPPLVALLFVPSLSRSYPTYEEWKLAQRKKSDKIFCRLFLSYL